MSKFSVEEVSPIERRINVEVEPQVIQQETERAYRTLSRQVRVPGFRPGKVPRRILEARYKEQVQLDVVQHLIEHSYTEALHANPQVFPVAPPKVTNQGLKEGEPFRYQALVEVKPQVDPKDYEGIELKKGTVEIPEEQVDQEVEKLRQSMAQLVPVEGRTVAQDGDWAVVDFEGSVGGKPFQGGKAQDSTFEIAPGDFIAGKAAGLAGLAIDQTRDLPFTFPKEDRFADLSGKEASFKVKLKGLKTRKVPELGDEMAKDAGDTTLADLKKRIRDELTGRATEVAERAEREQLMKALIERNPFEVPRAMVERAQDRMIEGAIERLARQGVDPRRLNLDFERMRESLRDSALAEVKGALLLEAIAAKEKIEAQDADVDAKVKEFSEKLQTPPEKVRAYLVGDAQQESALRLRIREEKTLAFLRSKAKILES